MLGCESMLVDCSRHMVYYITHTYKYTWVLFIFILSATTSVKASPLKKTFQNYCGGTSYRLDGQPIAWKH